MKEKNGASVLGSWIAVMVLLGSAFVHSVSGLKAASLASAGKPVFDTDLEDPYDLVVSPDGKNIYVPTNWRGGARGLALSADETRLYVAAAGDSSLTAYARDPATGRIGKVAQARQWINGLREFTWPEAVALSTGGTRSYAYVVTGADALHCFELGGPGGELCWDWVVFGDEKDTNQVQGLRGGQKLCMAPDGLNVYVPGSEDNVIVSFRRNMSTGLLSLLDSKHGVPPEGLDGLDGAHSVVVSPTNDYLYVDAWRDHCLSIFKFNK